MDFKLNIDLAGGCAAQSSVFINSNSVRVTDSLVGVKRKCMEQTAAAEAYSKLPHEFREPEPEELNVEYCQYSETFIRKSVEEVDPAYVKKFKHGGPLAPFPPLGGRGLMNGDSDNTKIQSFKSLNNNSNLSSKVTLQESTFDDQLTSTASASFSPLAEATCTTSDQSSPNVEENIENFQPRQYAHSFDAKLEPSAFFPQL